MYVNVADTYAEAGDVELKVAARLLKQGRYNISEIAYAVGFNNPKYFSTCFSEMFSVSPKEYMK